MSLDLSPSSLSGRTRSIPAGAWAAVVVAIALIASYLPSFHMLVMMWWNEPNYSHGFLVAPISGLILWMRRDRLPALDIRPSVFGWLGLVAILAARVYLYERNEMWVEQATIPLAAASLVLAFGGWQLLWWAAPGLAFLLFMLPLPPRINAIAAGPLQTMATMVSSNVLTLTGLPVLYEGHVIYVGQQPLEVARACSGLSMLMSFVALITAMTILQRDRPIWERVVLMLSTVPIALAANVLRIVATGWAYHFFGQEFGEKIAHDTAGWLMMPIALGLVWVELRLLAWLVVAEEVPTQAMVFLPVQDRPRPIKK
ncbi:MAG: hypothetical protein JWO68_4114 [Actinomycetia bacterium]|nr:hypothetical protein [Actinomycetes bacterium]